MPTISGSLNLVTDRPVDSISEVWVRARETRGQGTGLVVGVNDRVPVSDGAIEFTALPGAAVLVLVQNGVPLETLPMLVSDEAQQSLRAVVQAAEVASSADKHVIEQLSTEVAANVVRAEQYRAEAASSASDAQASRSAAATSESNAAASETNAKQSETNAGDYAAVATTAATEAVDAMERATDLAGGDFATHEYVDQKVLTGEGRPGGRVAAPQGVIYTDSAATTGAVQWFKAGGGTGTTGWRLLQGYTGIRSVPDLVTGLDFTQRDHHDAWIVREGNTVTLWGTGYFVGGAHLTSTLPDGFKPTQGHYVANAGSGVAGGEIYAVGHHNAWSRLTLSGGTPPVDSNLSIQVRWITSDNWPLILPGTPA